MRECRHCIEEEYPGQFANTTHEGPCYLDGKPRPLVNPLLNTDRALLLHGDYRQVLAGVGNVDTLISDPPFSEKTHTGHNRGEQSDDAERRSISYPPWGPSDVEAFVRAWSPRVGGWFVACTDHVLWPTYRDALLDEGRHVFHPIPVVIKGMTVRRQGDGPASWAFYLVVARPKSKTYMGGWASAGAYVGGKGSEKRHIGGKPLWAMARIVRAYSREGDVVVDPCAGYGSTARAALGLGRSFVGAEVDEPTARIAAAEIARDDHEARVTEALKAGAEWDPPPEG